MKTNNINHILHTINTQNCASQFIQSINEINEFYINQISALKGKNDLAIMTVKAAWYTELKAFI